MAERTAKEISEMEEALNLIKCPCDYFNKREYVYLSGGCKRCGKVLDEKAKFKSDMRKKLRTWRNKKW